MYQVAETVSHVAYSREIAGSGIATWRPREICSFDGNNVHTEVVGTRVPVYLCCAVHRQAIITIMRVFHNDVPTKEVT
jgi:hypothetical protein